MEPIIIFWIIVYAIFIIGLAIALCIIAKKEGVKEPDSAQPREKQNHTTKNAAPPPLKEDRQRIKNAPESPPSKKKEEADGEDSEPQSPTPPMFGCIKIPIYLACIFVAAAINTLFQSLIPTAGGNPMELGLASGILTIASFGLLGLYLPKRICAAIAKKQSEKAEQKKQKASVPPPSAGKQHIKKESAPERQAISAEYFGTIIGELASAQTHILLDKCLEEEVVDSETVGRINYQSNLMYVAMSMDLLNGTFGNEESEASVLISALARILYNNRKHLGMDLFFDGDPDLRKKSLHFIVDMALDIVLPDYQIISKPICDALEEQSPFALTGVFRTYVVSDLDLYNKLNPTEILFGIMQWMGDASRLLSNYKIVKE